MTPVSWFARSAAFRRQVLLSALPLNGAGGFLGRMSPPIPGEVARHAIAVADWSFQSRRCCRRRSSMPPGGCR